MVHLLKVTLRKGYSSADLKLDLANLYQKTGLKNLGTVFLMTDAQVADEKFLVLINNLLASGEIPDLFGDDEVENIVTMVRNEVKGAGLQVHLTLHFYIVFLFCQSFKLLGSIIPLGAE